MTTIFELDAVMIGGGVVDTGDLPLTPAREAAAEFAYSPQVRPLPPVLPSSFRSDAGNIGAELLALDPDLNQSGVHPGGRLSIR